MPYLIDSNILLYYIQPDSPMRATLLDTLTSQRYILKN